MLTFLNRFKIAAKLYGVVAATIVVFAVSMIWTTVYDHSNLEVERKAGLASLNDTVISILQHYYDREQAGDLTREEAQAEALSTVREMRYGDNGYFAINDMSGMMVLMPSNPALEGTDGLDVTSPDGVRVTEELINLVKKDGEGLIAFQWAKPGVTEPVLKYNHAIGFKPWGWNISTGAYVDDLSALFWQNATFVFAEIAAIILVVGLAAFVIIRRHRQAAARAAERDWQHRFGRHRCRDCRRRAQGRDRQHGQGRRGVEGLGDRTQGVAR